MAEYEGACNETLAALNETLLDLQSRFDECGCEADPCASEDLGEINTSLHIGAVFFILAASSIGVFFPLLSKRFNFPYYGIVLMKHFGTGIIIACALVHMLLPASESLTSECLGPAFSDEYPAYAYLFAVISIMIMHGTERGIRIYMTPSDGELDPNVTDSKPETQLMEHHSPSFDTRSTTSAVGTRVQAYMLEFGFTVHSIFIGLAVGVATDEFVPLVIALVFHQLFEGMGLGARLMQEGMRFIDSVLLALIFAISAPIDIMVGTIVTTQLQPGAQAFLLVQGILDALCAGILLYVGFVLLF